MVYLITDLFCDTFSVSCELFNMKQPRRNTWMCEVSEAFNSAARANAIAILNIPLISGMFHS